MSSSTLYSSLEMLAIAAERLDIKVDVNHLAHKLGRDDDGIDDIDLVRSAKWAGMKARVVPSHFSQLPAFSSSPVLVSTHCGWRLLESASDSEVILRSSAGKDIFSRQQFDAVSKGKLLLLQSSRSEVKLHKFGFRWFLPSILKHRSQFCWVIGVSLCMQIFALVSPMLFENVIDKVLVSRSLGSLQVLGLAMLGLAVAEPLYSLLRGWLFANMSSKVSAELSSRLYSHLTTLPLNYFGSRQTGQVIARIKEMEHIRQFLTGSALTMLLDMVFLMMFVAVMFVYSVKLTLVVLASLSIYLIYWLSVGPGLRNRVAREFEISADNTAFLTEAVTGVETIKTTATESRFFRRWESQLAQYIKASFDANCYGIWAGQGISLIQKLTAATLLWFGVKLVLEGKISPGELVAFNMLSGHVTQPILRLAQIWQDFQHTLISLRRVGDILDEPAEAGGGGIDSTSVMEGAVSFRSIHFRYQENAPEILKGLDLDIKPGEFIGITGPSGSGKSTLTRLLQRLYSPERGEVLVDGSDIAIVEPVTLRRQMSIVLQENHLFTGTIKENICLNCPDATDEKITNCAQLVGVMDFAADLPEGLESQVGEKGGLLSGGQRQRVALARALISDPKILILDEATSALDYESEAAIISNLAKICQGRTVISIAHRLNTIRHADRIAVIERGVIQELGSHDTLINKSGTYAHLWKLQNS